MKLNKQIAVSESGLVFNPMTGESFSVNPIGIIIIGLIQAENKQKDIQSHILDRYKVDQDTLEKDIQDFLSQLDQYHLLENYEEEA